MEQRFETFTVLISKISRYIRKIKTEEMVEFKLKSPHVTCLYYLYKNKTGMTAKQIISLCDEDKAAISRSLDYLEKQGLIECSMPQEKRYRSLLKLTKTGISVGSKIAEKIDEIVNLASDGITDSDREVLYKSLNLINENLQKICDTYGGN